jgi:alanine dehydrogenase
MESSKSVGIRNEDKNKWERRCAITPKEVAYLVSEGIRVYV